MAASKSIRTVRDSDACIGCKKNSAQTPCRCTDGSQLGVEQAQLGRPSDRSMLHRRRPVRMSPDAPSIGERDASIQLP